jgi:hypothetical protein
MYKQIKYSVHIYNVVAIILFILFSIGYLGVKVMNNLQIYILIFYFINENGESV